MSLLSLASTISTSQASVCWRDLPHCTHGHSCPHCFRCSHPRSAHSAPCPSWPSLCVHQVHRHGPVSSNQSSCQMRFTTIVLLPPFSALCIWMALSTMRHTLCIHISVLTSTEIRVSWRWYILSFSTLSLVLGRFSLCFECVKKINFLKYYI